MVKIRQSPALPTPCLAQCTFRSSSYTITAELQSPGSNRMNQLIQCCPRRVARMLSSPDQNTRWFAGLTAYDTVSCASAIFPETFCHELLRDKRSSIVHASAPLNCLNNIFEVRMLRPRQPLNNL